ncbi:hypothetical protein FQR65_LT01864 [Abscondita terminalis]|nr:hypothetical protein FQR65_LT01864 [Abscondita terminalis]
MDQDMPFGDFGNYRDFVDDLAVELLLTSDPELDPLNVSSISWMNQKKTPLEYLDNIYTRDGVCYNFNMLNINDILKDPEEYAQNVSAKVQKIKGWSLDEGYPDAFVTDSFPRRTSLSGVSGGFVFDSMYVNSSHLDYVCGDSLQGFKVVLHHPADYPNLDKYFRVPLDTGVYVGIKPRYTTISEELKHYSPKDRKCYLSNEKPLSYFKTYTQNNCMEECFANYTLKTCGCQSFYMPKLPDSLICGPGKRKCVDDSRVNYVKDNANECDCLPSCTSLEYDVELTQSVWDWKSTLTTFNELGLEKHLEHWKWAHLSRLAVYFKENQFLNSERQELYGVVDFFANIGGLMGLFTGFSVTSFVEIVYFCTLRLWCNCKKYGRRYWSGEAELLEEKDE